MRSFEIFRSKDPQVSAWLQNNGYRNGFQEKGEKALQNSKMQEEPDVKNKNVKFSIGKYVHSKIPSLASRQTLPELRTNKTAEAHGRGHLKNLDELRLAISSEAVKRVVYQEKSEPPQTFAKNAMGPRTRTFSSPQLHNDHAIKGRPNLSRRYSSFSSSSDIPVQIRNNNVWLRKYSCPEHYIPAKILEKDQGEDGELETYGFGKNLTLNATSNFAQQLATKSSNQTSGRKSREQTKDHTTQALKGKSILEDKIPPRVDEKYAKRQKDNTARKDFKNSHFVTSTDMNANEIVPISSGQMSGCLSESSDEDVSQFTLNEEESLQSYSLEVQPKSRRNNFPSSMYSRRGTMLTWLGEVNRYNPQFWS